MLQTIEEMLHEALKNNLDLSVGYSVLKDIFKRQNFTVESAKTLGKDRVVYMYTDKEAKNPDKINKITLTFSIKHVDEKEKNSLSKSAIKNPHLSFTLNKYFSLIKLFAPVKKYEVDVRAGIALIEERQTVGKEANYKYLSFVYNNDNGDFVDSYTIDINAKK